MPLPEGTTNLHIKRLLELFPVTTVREVWGMKGSRDEICQIVAEQQQPDAIINFVDSHLGCCRQHCHVFERDGQVNFPATLGGAAPVVVAREHALYVLRSVYNVVLKNPYEDATLEFLWPVRIDVIDNYVAARFVVLEKNLNSYFDRPYLLNNRTSDEQDIVREIVAELGFPQADLHAGIKSLWVQDYMDSNRARYKRPRSLAYEAMDEERGIKEADPELYARLLDSVLFSSLFVINPDHERARDLTVSHVSVDPSTGYIAFPRFSDRVGDTDRVIREILTNNQ